VAEDAFFQGAGLSHSAGVGRVSSFFGFEGPCLAIDTASSSSLVADLSGGPCSFKWGTRSGPGGWSQRDSLPHQLPAALQGGHAFPGRSL